MKKKYVIKDPISKLYYTGGNIGLWSPDIKVAKTFSSQVDIEQLFNNSSELFDEKAMLTIDVVYSR